MNTIERLRSLYVLTAGLKEDDGIGWGELFEIRDELPKILDAVEATQLVLDWLRPVTTNFGNPDGSPEIIIKYTTAQLDDVKALREALAVLRKDDHKTPDQEFLTEEELLETARWMRSSKESF